MGNPVPILNTNVAIINGGPELLSTFQYIYDALGINSDEENEFRSKSFSL